MQQALVLLRPKRTTSPMDKGLAAQSLSQVDLAPTPRNLDPIHVPAADLLGFIQVQQWVLQHLKLKLPLLQGVLVLVRSTDLQQRPTPAELQEACGVGTTTAASVAAAVPLRLRQVSAVEATVGADPAAASVLLQGPYRERVAAGAVGPQLLTEVGQNEYLCCELADLQCRGQQYQLQVFDVAHIAWRLRVACELEAVMQTHQQVQAGLAAGHIAHEAAASASSTALESAKAILMKLPPDDWVQAQIVPCLDLNPLQSQAAVDPATPQQLPTPEQHMQMLREAAATWQQFVRGRVVEKLQQQQQPQQMVLQEQPVQQQLLKLQGHEQQQLEQELSRQLPHKQQKQQVQHAQQAPPPPPQQQQQQQQPAAQLEQPHQQVQPPQLYAQPQPSPGAEAGTWYAAAPAQQQQWQQYQWPQQQWQHGDWWQQQAHQQWFQQPQHQWQQQQWQEHQWHHQEWQHRQQQPPPPPRQPTAPPKQQLAVTASKGPTGRSTQGPLQQTPAAVPGAAASATAGGRDAAAVPVSPGAAAAAAASAAAAAAPAGPGKSLKSTAAAVIEVATAAIAAAAAAAAPSGSQHAAGAAPAAAVANGSGAAAVPVPAATDAVAAAAPAAAAATADMAARSAAAAAAVAMAAPAAAAAAVMGADSVHQAALQAKGDLGQAKTEAAQGVSQDTKSEGSPGTKGVLQAKCPETSSVPPHGSHRSHSSSAHSSRSSHSSRHRTNSRGRSRSRSSRSRSRSRDKGRRLNKARSRSRSPSPSSSRGRRGRRSRSMSRVQSRGRSMSRVQSRGRSMSRVQSRGRSMSRVQSRGRSMSRVRAARDSTAPKAVQQAAQAWLPRLAKLLLPAPEGPQTVITSSRLGQVLPLSAVLRKHYGTLLAFARQAPELVCANSQHGNTEVSFVSHEVHMALLAGRTGEVRLRDAPGGDGKSRGGTGKREQERERSPLTDWRRANTRSRSNSRGRCRSHRVGKPSRSPGGTRSRSMGRGRSASRSRSPPVGSHCIRTTSAPPEPTPAAPPGADSVQDVVQEWLQQLALLLKPVRSKDGPPSIITISSLRRTLPVPVRVVRHYGSVCRFLKRQPELAWHELEHCGAIGFRSYARHMSLRLRAQCERL